MLIVISLPQAPLKFRLTQFANAGYIPIGSERLERTNRIPQRRGRPRACPGPLLRRPCHHLGAHKGRPYGGGTHEGCPYNVKDTVKMIGHDNELIQLHRWKPSWHFFPLGAYHAAGVAEFHQASGHIAKHKPIILNTYRHVIPAWRGIVMLAPANRPSVMDFRVVHFVGAGLVPARPGAPTRGAPTKKGRGERPLPEDVQPDGLRSRVADPSGLHEDY